MTTGSDKLDSLDIWLDNARGGYHGKTLRVIAWIVTLIFFAVMFYIFGIWLPSHGVSTDNRPAP